MKRLNWLDENTDYPLLTEHAQKLEHFTKALADGMIDKDELEKQRQAVVAAMKAVEPTLSDDVHDRVTRLLVELTAYNIMEVLHGLATERVRKAFGGK